LIDQAYGNTVADVYKVENLHYVEKALIILEPWRVQLALKESERTDIF
jgi:hypothetical protein